MKMTLFYKAWETFVFSIVCAALFSCSNELHMLFPEGPEGPAGKSAYEVWVDEVNNGNIDWPNDRTDVNNFFLYLKGKDGKDGQDGKDGKSAYEIWIEEVNNGLDNPHNPGHDWPKNEIDINDFWYYLTGADGKDGVTPNIGSNGNWWVNGEDTGVPAKGKDGQDGEDGKDGEDGDNGSMPDITIGDNGNWHINGVDTGKPARGPEGPKGDKGDQGEQGPQGPKGEDGEDGKNGLSAYELWKQELANGTLPGKNGERWPTDKNTINDFWEYLRGEDGKDGADGKDGETIIQQEPVKGKYNVIAMYSENNGNAKEFVAWKDGKVRYTVYDTEQKAISNAKVVLKNLNSEETYTTNDEGVFYVKNENLPDRKNDPTTSFEKVKSLIVNDKTIEEGSIAENTYVPSKIKVRLRLNSKDGTLKLPRFHSSSFGDRALKGAWEVLPLDVDCIFERKVDSDSEWEVMPTGVEASLPIRFYDYNKGSLTERHITRPDQQKLNPISNLTQLSADNPLTVRIPRKVIDSEYLSINNINIETENSDLTYKYEYWGQYDQTKKKYITIGFEPDKETGGCYGERVLLSSVNETTGEPEKTILMQDVPVQPMPLPAEIVFHNFGTSPVTNNVISAQAKIKLNNSDNTLQSQVKVELIFKRYYVEGSVDNLSEYTVYVPEQLNLEDFCKKSVYVVWFSGGTGQTSQNLKTGTQQFNNMDFFTFDQNTNIVNNMRMYVLPDNDSYGNFNFMGYSCALFSLSGEYDQSSLKAELTKENWINDELPIKQEKEIANDKGE